MLDLAGIDSGTLAGSSTGAGVVPTDATAGFPAINSFNGATGYIAKAEGSATQASAGAIKFSIYDLLFKAGPYNFNDSISLSSQPSYASRVPGGTDFKGTEIWLECVTAFTGNLSAAVTYTDQTTSGTGHTTGTFDTGLAMTVGRLMQMPFAPGDCGVSKIESVVATIAAAGTFNVLVMRPLIKGFRVQTSDTGFLGPDKTGMPIVFDTSALYPIISSDTVTSGLPDIMMNLAPG